MSPFLPTRLILAAFLLVVGLAPSASTAAETAGASGVAAGPQLGSPASVALPGETKLDLVWIKPGTFLMGSPEVEVGPESRELPQTKVTLSKGFWLGKYEVTQAQWAAVMGTTMEQILAARMAQPHAVNVEIANRGLGADYPVYMVDWKTAMDFCAKLTALERAAGHLPEGYEYTLPTEAQWEYAARAGTTTKYYNGDDDAKLDDIAWYAKTPARLDETPAPVSMHPVGQKQPNAWGLYDMLGNTNEWCYDVSHSNRGYPGGSVTDFVVFEPNPFKGYLLRGGSVVEGASGQRVAGQEHYNAAYIRNATGFRVALTQVPRPPSVVTSTAEAVRPTLAILEARDRRAGYVPFIPTTAQARLEELQASLQKIVEALKPLPADPVWDKVTAETNLTLTEVTAALAYVKAHPEANPLPVDAGLVAVPALPVYNSNAILTRSAYAQANPTLATVVSVMDYALHDFLIGAPPSSNGLGRSDAGGAVIGELDGHRDALIRHLGRLADYLKTATSTLTSNRPRATTSDVAVNPDVAPGSISGIVLDGDGDPAEYVLIGLTNIADMSQPTRGRPQAIREDSTYSSGLPITLSNERGEFTIKGLPPGTYIVTGVLGAAQGGRAWSINGSVQPIEVKAGAETKISRPLKLKGGF